MITPDGHLIFTSFKNNLLEVILYRSNEVFAGTVSTLTFSKLTVITGSVQHSESCLGYFNDKFVLISRCEGTNPATIMVTSDLEGLTGWSSPVSLNISCQSPLLLPHYNGKYLPVVGSRMVNASGTGDRRPTLYYLDVDNATCVAYGELDNTLMTAYNGYPTFLPLGDENYAVAYYQENVGGSNAQYPNAFAGVYYKWINAREILPQATYLDL